MKKIYIYLILLAIVFGVIGYYLGKMNNGPKEETPINISNIPSRFEE